MYKIITSLADLRLDVHNCEDSLVKDCISDILRSLSIGGHLGKDVAHGVACFAVPFAECAKKSENCDLKERIGDS